MTSELGHGHERPDPPAADAGDHGRAARRGRRPPVRDPARPHRAHRARWPTSPSARSPAAACSCCPTACCRSSTPPSARRLRPPPTPPTPSSSAAASERFALAVARLVGQRELVTRPLPPEVADGAALSGARRALGRADRPDRRLRRASSTSPSPPEPRKEPDDAGTRTCSSTRCASWPTSAPAPPATALSSMLGRSVDITVPSAARAAARRRRRRDRRPPRPRSPASCCGVVGDLRPSVLLLFTPDDAAPLCGCSASRPAPRSATPALSEIGNIVGASYLNALGADDRHGARADAARGGDRHARRDRARPCSPSAPAPATSRCCWTPSSSSRARTARSRSCSSPTRAASTSCSRGWAL